MAEQSLFSACSNASLLRGEAAQCLMRCACFLFLTVSRRALCCAVSAKCLRCCVARTACADCIAAPRSYVPCNMFKTGPAVTTNTFRWCCNACCASFVAESVAQSHMTGVVGVAQCRSLCLVILQLVRKRCVDKFAVITAVHSSVLCSYGKASQEAVSSRQTAAECTAAPQS
jgi:hypothetical protein